MKPRTRLSDKLFDDGSDRINLYCSRVALGLIGVLLVLVAIVEMVK